MFTEIQSPKPGIGLGDFILREFITSNRYRQQPFNDSMNSVDVIRMREIEDDINLTTVPRSTIYDQIILVFSVPRRGNYTGVHDNDQYMICVDLPTGNNALSFLNTVSSSLTLVGSNVTLQYI